MPLVALNGHLFARHLSGRPDAISFSVAKLAEQRVHALRMISANPLTCDVTAALADSATRVVLIVKRPNAPIAVSALSIDLACARQLGAEPLALVAKAEGGPATN